VLNRLKTDNLETGVPMKLANLTAALTVAGLLAATPVLAQMKQPQNPAYPSDGGVAGGLASSTDKNAATKQSDGVAGGFASTNKDDPSKQKAQTLTPSGGQADVQSGKQK
jgi:hypothetical protein